MEDGYIKYICIWNKSEIIISETKLAEINKYRGLLIELGMIGKIQNGPGFGNISVKRGKNEFIISGSNTGHLSELYKNHIALVTKTNIEKNSVWCKGLTKASSESMSHAIIYKELKDVNVVIHIHHKEIWNYYLNKQPTTSNSVSYGTPDMALQIKEKLKNSPISNTIILGGHEDGIIVFGQTLSDAFVAIKKLFNAIC